MRIHRIERIIHNTIILMLLLAIVLLNPVEAADVPTAKKLTNTTITDTAMGENGNCLSCHNNAGYLMQAVTPEVAPP